MKKVIVIGGGPAGISAAIYAKRGGAEVTVFTMGGGALEKADKIENYYGFPGGISGTDLIAAGEKQAQELGIELCRAEVVGLEYSEEFRVTAVAETDLEVQKEITATANVVIVAMGSPRKVPPVENIKEFEGRGVSYCAICDGFFFRGKDVAVLGSGEYAKHEAEVLKPIAGSVTMIPEEDAAAVEGDGESEFSPLQKVLLKDGSSLEVSGLFVASGSAGSADLARKLGAMTEGNKILVDENMATNVPGLFAAGDCTGGLMQVAKAVHEGAAAGLAAVKFLRANG